MTVNIFEALEPARSRQTETREAQARAARIRFFADVKGIGEIRMEGKSALFFGAIMLEEPSFTWGVIAGTKFPRGGVPLAGAMVLKWRKQGDFWVGADLAFIIDSADINTRLKFSLTFEAVTLRTTNPLAGQVRS